MLSHLPEIIQPGCKHRQPQPRTPALKHSSVFPLLLKSFLGSFCIFIGIIFFLFAKIKLLNSFMPALLLMTISFVKFLFVLCYGFLNQCLEKNWYWSHMIKRLFFLLSSIKCYLN